MHSTLRVALTDMELGARGWRLLHDDADIWGRHPSKQALALIQWAIKQRLDGKNVELTRAQLEQLLNDQLETVA